jgi:hypothetical protein
MNEFALDSEYTVFRSVGQDFCSSHFAWIVAMADSHAPPFFVSFDHAPILVIPTTSPPVSWTLRPRYLPSVGSVLLQAQVVVRSLGARTINVGQAHIWLSVIAVSSRPGHSEQYLGLQPASQRLPAFVPDKNTRFGHSAGSTVNDPAEGIAVGHGHMDMANR